MILSLHLTSQEWKKRSQLKVLAVGPATFPELVHFSLKHRCNLLV